MARNRQRAKQRQAERRARRLEEQKAPPEPAGDGSPVPGVIPEIDPNLAAGAPPKEEGRSDAVLEDEPELEEDEHLEEYEVEAEEEAEEDEAYAPRGRRSRQAAERAAARDRPRVVQFLVAVWAELQRVEWPNRQALTTLTGVVLGFVLIAGGYLGLLDAIFSRIIKAIL
ncbi:MAG TPA: preprotein translocase subunit SecE [Thermoleophilaceae bacterium]|nr:preprotein translocase subunit SecE [Thermoleophilaceae bacterium]